MGSIKVREFCERGITMGIRSDKFCLDGRDGSKSYDEFHQSNNHVPGRRLFLKKLASSAGVSIFSITTAKAQQSYQSNGFQLPPAHPEQLKAEFREILQKFGDFSQHPTYGEIWRPNIQTAPQGWHPYPPCHWVHSRKFGWYFDDKTPWGQIVHHYGRWKNDPTSGWFWVSGGEFSPGWVLWRSNPQYIGWAPMPPDQDLQNAQAASLENTDSWLFMEVQKFGRSCEGSVLPSGMYPAILKDTKFITRVKIVDGIVIYEFPVYIDVPFIDILVTFDPWPLWFLTQFFIYINWIWNYVLIINVKVNCEPSTEDRYPAKYRNRRGLFPSRR